MRMFLVGVLVLFGWSVTALAQTAVDAKNLTFEALMEGMQSYEVVLTKNQKGAVLDALKTVDKRAFENMQETLTKGDRIAAQYLLFLLAPNQPAICKVFAEHEDPMVRFVLQYELGKSGDKQAAAKLHTLFREQFSEHQAQMLRTMASIRGIVPEKDSVHSIAILLASYGRKTHKLKAGDVVEKFRVADVDGKLVSLDSLEGKPTLFHFWATWCAPCMAQMDECVNRIKDYPSDVNVVFVNLDLDRETCVTAMKKIDLKCIHVYGENQVLSRVFGIKGIPHDAWVDANGKFVPNETEDVDRLLQGQR